MNKKEQIREMELDLALLKKQHDEGQISDEIYLDSVALIVHYHNRLAA